MADIGMPDTLTPDQMAKLGGASHPDQLPDTLTPDEMEHATEQPRPPKSHQFEDFMTRQGGGGLDVDAPLASPRGVAFDRRLGAFVTPGEIQPPQAPSETPLIREDPGMDVATAMAGAGVGKLAGKGVAKLGSKVLPKLIEPAVAGATTAKLQGASNMGALKAAGVGAALGIPGAVLTAVRGAPAAVSERLPTAVTGASKAKAAKQVVAGAPIADMLQKSHPELYKVLSTGDLAEKFNATGATLNKLSSANDAVYEAIQAQHQGIPFDPVAKKIQAVAAAAHKAGDGTLEDAANAAIENLQRFTDVADKRGPIVSATQLRGVRNNLARRVQAINPTLGASDVQAAADEIKRAINDGIEDIAGQTKGVDVKALRDRNQQIAQLMPVQRSLRAQVIDKKLLGPEDRLADLIEHPQHEIAGLVRKAPAHIDAALATSPRLQAFAAGARSPLPDLATRTLMAGTAARAGRRDDLEYATRVSQLMKEGKTLQEATQEAGR